MFGLSKKEKLFNAARNVNVRDLDSLIKSGIDVNSIGKYGFSPLLVACDMGEVDLAKHLVEVHNGNPMYKTKMVKMGFCYFLLEGL